MIQDGYGRPPRGEWAGLVPELYVTDSAKSIRHWCDVFGFTIAYQRPEERFAYLDRPEGSQIMICERCGAWETGAFDHPLGRGVLFQVFVSNLAEIHQSVLDHGYALYAGRARSGAVGAIAKAASERSSCRTQMDTSSCSRKASGNVRSRDRRYPIHASTG